MPVSPRPAPLDPAGRPRLCPVSRDRPAALLNGPALTRPAQQAPPGWSRLCPVSRDHPAALPGPALTRPAHRDPVGRSRLCPVSRDRPAALQNGPAPDPVGPSKLRLGSRGCVRSAATTRRPLQGRLRSRPAQQVRRGDRGCVRSAAAARRPCSTGRPNPVGSLGPPAGRGRPTAPLATGWPDPASPAALLNGPARIRPAQETPSGATVAVSGQP